MQECGLFPLRTGAVLPVLLFEAPRQHESPMPISTAYFLPTLAVSTIDALSAPPAGYCGDLALERSTIRPRRALLIIRTTTTDRASGKQQQHFNYVV